MKKKNLSNCPVCNGKLNIVKYQCGKCHTEIVGDFKQDKFAQLTQEERDFVEVFVLNRGSIKDIEKELNISYPTVRNKLDQVISALGHKVNSDKGKIDILNMLDRGEISSEEATALLNEINERG